MLDSALKAVLTNRGLTLVRIVNRSSHKQTLTAVVEDGQSQFLLKLSTDAGNRASLTNLEREANYYRMQRENTHVPALEIYGGSYLLTRFVSNQTLRESLALTELTEAEVIVQSTELADLITAFNHSGATTSRALSFQESKEWIRLAILRKTKDILLGGPRSLPSNWWQRVYLQSVYRITYPLLRHRAGILSEQLLAHSVQYGLRYHGDLHCDNILVDDEGKFFLIDFECSEETPGMAIDTAFCYATYAVQHSHAQVCRTAMLNKLFPSGDYPEALLELLELFYSLCVLNPRFRASEKCRRTEAGFVACLLGLKTP